MKPIELHLYLPFSYWLDRDPETGAPLRRPDERALSVWLRALCTELSSLKEDCADCEVTALRFHGGYLSLLDAEDLSRLLIAVHRSFSLRKDCPVCGLMFPGRLDMEMVAAYGNRHVSPLLFTLPSLSFRECERLGYPVALQALDKTVYFLQNFSVEEWGLQLPIGIPGRDAETWRFLLGQIYHYHPKYLRFASIDPGRAEDPAFAEICAELERHGYHRAAENLFSLADAVPRLLLPLPADAEYVGAGPGAVSRIDGFTVHNTADFEVWCRNCGDWRQLVVKAEPV